MQVAVYCIPLASAQKSVFNSHIQPRYKGGKVKATWGDKEWESTLALTSNHTSIPLFMNQTVQSICYAVQGYFKSIDVHLSVQMLQFEQGCVVLVLQSQKHQVMETCCLYVVALENALSLGMQLRDI